MNREITALIRERDRDPAMLTWYRFVRVLRKIIANMDELMQDLDVSRSQFDLLMQVAFEAGVNQQTCADRMNVTKGNIAQHVNWLEKNGLIIRQKEGRTNYLYLTEQGKELMANIMPLHDRRVREILSVLSWEELRQFQSIVRKFDRGLR
jgi:MarR family 2-MHQ and catechol resistance regulon transcriptional repressor